jgi:mannose/fructose-specific phosphotransferase system component IIA
MDRVRFITHRGREILLVDLTNCTAEDVIESLSEVQRIVTAQPRNSVLALGDLTGAQFSRAAVTRMKDGNPEVYSSPTLHGDDESSQGLGGSQ